MKTIQIRMKCGMFDKTFTRLWSEDIAAHVKEVYKSNFMRNDCYVWLNNNYHGIVNYYSK